MRRVAKLHEKPLILPFEEVNAEDSDEKSLFGTAVHPVSKPKAKTDKKRGTKKISSSSEPTASQIIRVQTLTTQAFKSHQAEEPEPDLFGTANDDPPHYYKLTMKRIPKVLDFVQENIVKEAKHTAKEQHHDDEFVHSELHSIEPLITSMTKENSDIEEDSNLASIPDDEVGSPSDSQTSKTEEDTQSEPVLSKSDERDADKAEITSLSTKVDQLESSITKKTLRTSLPLLLKDLIKESVVTSIEEKLPLFDTQLQHTLKDQLPALIIKPMYKEFNEFNKMEANRFVHLQEELSKIMNMVSLLKLAEVLKQTNAEGEKGIIHASEEKASEEKASDKETTDDEPLTKRLKVLILTPIPLISIFPEPTTDPTPPRVFELLPEMQLLLEIKEKFSTSGEKITLEEAEAQLSHLKRLVDLKAKEEESEKALLRMLNPARIEAQAQKMAKYEAKRTKMLAGYNHYITFRADQRRITKINYKIDRVTRDATMRIERDNQPLSLIVIEKFGLKQLGFSEWIEIQALTSKGKKQGE
ncbi:hypothetical protein Tco_1013940 [Tanacetum coccineum]